MVAAALAVIVCSIAFLSWLTTGPGFLDTARDTTDPAEVSAIAAADLGLAAPPPGVTGVGLHEDDFQDRIVWVRLRATGAGLDALLAAHGHTRNDLGLHSPDRFVTFKLLSGADWWRSPSKIGVIGTTDLASQTLAHLTLTVIEDGTTPGLWHLYLRGHKI